ncbi:MAG: hypothetical protein E7557_03040 [Ruminococcaceae bacterium]|nr:hypothetical protein [Oscillospiraceae bacterium]
MKKFGLTNNQLKIIAMLAMLLDHIGKELLPQYPVLQIIGRLAFPIFAYMIAEGCFYTKNKMRYFLTVALLGVGCQAVYLVVEHSFYQNILITFSLSIILIFSLENFRIKREKISAIILFSTVFVVLAICTVMPVALKEQGFQIDYGVFGVLLPVAVFYAPDKSRKLVYTTGILILLSNSFGGIQWFSLFAVPLLALYNQKRGKYNIKPLFYIFYPAHLVVIYLIALFLNK